GHRLFSNGVAAHLQRFGLGHASIAAIGLPKSAIVPVYTIARPIVEGNRAAVIPESTRDGRSVSPKQVERVAFGSALAILNFDNGRAAVIPRIAHQSLPASAVHACKPEVRRIGGHCSRTLEPPPLRRLSSRVPQRCV